MPENHTLYLRLQFDARRMFAPENERDEDVRAMHEAAKGLKGRFMPAVADDNRSVLVSAFAKEGHLLWAYEKRVNYESVRFVADDPVNDRVEDICAQLDPRYSRISAVGTIFLPN